MLLSSAQEIAMTDLTLATRKPGFIARLVRRFLDWMAEEVEADAPLQLSPRDWADLPTHHPIRDDMDGR
jgi:hypothetical protein